MLLSQLYTVACLESSRPCECIARKNVTRDVIELQDDKLLRIFLIDLITVMLTLATGISYFLYESVAAEGRNGKRYGDVFIFPFKCSKPWQQKAERGLPHMLPSGLSSRRESAV